MEEIPSTPLEPPETVPSVPLEPAKPSQIPSIPLQPAQPTVPRGVVPWDEDAFLSRFPQFQDKLTDGQLEQAWELACLVLRNDSKSMVPYDPERGIFTRRSLLFLLMCHMCTLALRPFDQAGPVTSASEGSVSAGFSVPTRPDSTYFCQTPCGATYWQLIQQYAKGGYYFAVEDYHPWG